MKNRVHLWVCLIFTVTSCLIAPAAAQEPQILTFPAVAAVTETGRTLTFTLPGATASAVSFHCAGLVEPVTGNRINGDRLTFSYGQKKVGPNQVLTLNTKPTGKPEPDSAREFGLQITFLPSDPPGEYGGIIEAVLHDSTEQAERIPLWVKARVLPWIKVETASVQPFARPDPVLSLTEHSLEINEPVKVFLASNAPWRLYLRAGMAIPDQDRSLLLHIKIGHTGQGGEEQKTLLVNGPSQLVATGPPTVVGDGLAPANYWTELYLSAFLADWRQYPTGNYPLTFIFSGETINP
ncbi:MAG TPA: hypothetical protein GXZ98_05380 [Firmicutes bacterium]|jgi:hypothetical protein|nr:hypothetical protein [Bacillota bacterium]